MPGELHERVYEATAALARLTAPAAEKLKPELKPVYCKVGTGDAVFCGDGSPLTQCGRLAYQTDFDPNDLDAVEEFYQGRATNWEYTVTPFQNKRLLPEVVRRGWTNVQFENVMAQPLAELPEVSRDVEIVEATGGLQPTFCEVAMRAFFGEVIPPGMAGLAELITAIEGTHSYIAYIDGQPAATAAFTQVGSTVYLGGAATLPEFRQRGAQSALLAHRLARAKALGCDLALCEATPGSQSQRNQERVGFRVVYTKLVLTRPETDACFPE